MLKTKLLHLFYNITTIFILPIAILRLLWKSYKNSDYRHRIGERFAYQLPKTKNPIWIHAVSVGELMAVLTLIKELQKVYPLLITTTTPTGSAMVKKKLGSSVSHCYLPFDIPILVKRFLQKIKPTIAVFVETEIWANYLHNLKKQNIPALLINARLSEKSFRNYAIFDKFTKYTLACFTEIACQNKISKQRFQRLGANATMVGNIKFDLKLPNDLLTKQKKLIALLNNNSFILAASTHKGEEEIILQAFQNSDYNYTHCLFIAPRHPERSYSIMEICQDMGINASYYTQISNGLPDNTKVVIIDVLGELLYFYSLAKFAIIGGSFIDHGGHNPLEAALFATPCIIGKHYFNFKPLIDSMIDNNAIIVCSPNQLFSKHYNLEIIASNAHNFLTNNQGSLQKYIKLIKKTKNNPAQ